MNPLIPGPDVVGGLCAPPPLSPPPNPSPTLAPPGILDLVESVALDIEIPAEDETLLYGLKEGD